jgi:hypothetical protein
MGVFPVVLLQEVLPVVGAVGGPDHGVDVPAVRDAGKKMPHAHRALVAAG